MQLAGREGHLDTALSTAVNGDLQRKLTKSLENVVVAYDMSLRTTDGKLLEAVFNCGRSIQYDRLAKVNGSKVVCAFDIESIVTQINAECGWARSDLVYSEEEAAKVKEQGESVYTTSRSRSRRRRKRKRTRTDSERREARTNRHARRIDRHARRLEKRQNL